MRPAYGDKQVGYGKKLICTQFSSRFHVLHEDFGGFIYDDVHKFIESLEIQRMESASSHSLGEDKKWLDMRRWNLMFGWYTVSKDTHNDSPFDTHLNVVVQPYNDFCSLRCKLAGNRCLAGEL
jgi:hypothetical protein